MSCWVFYLYLENNGHYSSLEGHFAACQRLEQVEVKVKDTRVDSG